MSEKLKQSLENGIHNKLNKLSGNWKGISRVWFEPGKLADESTITGTFRSVLNKMFVIHEYNTTLEGKPVEGMAIFGHSLGENKLQCAWIDSFHNGTAIMMSENNAPAGAYSVLAEYSDEPKWGWRTVVDFDSDEKLTITMYNIAPGGKDEKAVEIIYERIS